MDNSSNEPKCQKNSFMSLHSKEQFVTKDIRILPTEIRRKAAKLYNSPGTKASEKILLSDAHETRQSHFEMFQFSNKHGQAKHPDCHN